jgi:hypothetical protein
VVLSAWIQHAPFGFWIVDALRPRRLVELGTHNGYSYFVFLQAVKALQLRCSCVAIDTWEGDEHSGHYDELVFEELRHQHDMLYADFSDLLKARFEDAVDRFDAGSVDLLHIDGSHFYQDVRRDFETWKPKLSDRAVVLLHDTRVYSREFGVHKLWEELSAEFPNFEFTHGHGLGVLGIGRDLPERVRELLNASACSQSATLVRQLYSRLGEAIYTEWDQSTRIGALTADGETLRHQIHDLNVSLRNALDEHSRLLSALDEHRQKLVAATNLESQLRVELQNTYNTLAVASQQRDESVASSVELGLELQKANELRSELQKANAGLRERDTALKNILASRSWRMCTFIRKVVDGVRHPGRILSHYTPGGERAVIAKSGLFDVQWYLAKYKDVRQAGSDPIRHYLRFGASEGRDPSPLFDTRWYLSKYADVAQGKANPLVHFITHGWREGRDPNPMFDTDWYLATYPDVAAAGCNPLVHYLQVGAAEQRDPSPEFDTGWYLSQHPQIVHEDINPLGHYLQESTGPGKLSRSTPADAAR